MPTNPDALPIDEVLEPLRSALAARNSVVLVAPPGAGKTTRVPLALLNESFLEGHKILVLEPRRLAARAAAQRMASTLGETVGDTVGLRVRMEQQVSSRTRIEVVTEGVFTALISGDPSLEGVGAVLFDEFHERSLDADLSLALAIDAQGGLREDLRLLVMSATLDGARVSRLLSGAPVIESAGRAFPVETRYVGRDPTLRIEDAVVRVALEAMRVERGSLLVFLPGQGEISRAAALLAERVRDPTVDVAPLFGAMDRDAQNAAIAPCAPGRRKIVLATAIAETSLTIEGVRIVIDSGLARAPRYEPDVGITRLETERVSRAGADQRRGRAGRTEPGVCYRLWEEAANGALTPFAKPEILSADLSGFVLDLAAWGVADPARLAFLDPPPAPASAEARTLLNDIGALDSAGRITEEGRAIAKLSLPPRLARMVVEAAALGETDRGAELAVLISERGLGGDAIDLAERLERWRRDRSSRSQDARRLAKRLANQVTATRPNAPSVDISFGALLAFGFSQRIAKARGKRGEFLMANGRAAMLDAQSPLAGEAFIAVGEATGRAAATRILSAAALNPEEIDRLFGDRIETSEDTRFDRDAAALRRRRRKKLGAILLSEQNLSVDPTEENAILLANGLLSLGLSRLPWSKETKQWRDRAAFLAKTEPGEWPDLSDAALQEPAWLAPFLLGASGLSDVTPDLLARAMEAQLPFNLQRRLEADAPTHFVAPTGSGIAVDYEAEGGPAIALRVQELYGLATHPALAGGKAPLTLHLLSPAHRPIQITRDLPGFWRGSWAAVKAEMRGRYPRHVWPDDPAGAAPTTRAKPRAK
jgi:ATP-dependent helicase HrpB